MRTEKDNIGFAEIPDDALYGIHSIRAKNNFPYPDNFHLEWYKSMGIVKLSVYKTYLLYLQALSEKKKTTPGNIKLVSEKKMLALIDAAEKMSQGDFFNNFIVPATQGGAGTSINMNCNEIITNLALQSEGRKPGDYQYIDPIETANIFQSTNDVIPTSLAIASLNLLSGLESSINNLRENFEKIERKHRDVLRTAYTQMQRSLPSSYGRLFSTYSDALSRDWWRISKCKERLKTVNIGGSAIGTSLNVPRFFVMQNIQTLQQLTQLPIARAENLSDATSNTDRFVEVHAILKAHAVNLEKMASDIRLLSSDMMQNRSLEIPSQQVGSSIMPGKKNPVIPEYVITIAHKVYANDQLISSLSGQGCLELNPYLPAIGDALLNSIEMLTHANNSLQKNLLENIMVNEQAAYKELISTPTITTALIPFIGYHKAEKIAKEMQVHELTIFEANKKLDFINQKKLEKILSADKLLKGGFTLEDLSLE